MVFLLLDQLYFSLYMLWGRSRLRYIWICCCTLSNNLLQLNKTLRSSWVNIVLLVLHFSADLAFMTVFEAKFLKWNSYMFTELTEAFPSRLPVPFSFVSIRTFRSRIGSFPSWCLDGYSTSRCIDMGGCRSLFVLSTSLSFRCHCCTSFQVVLLV